MHDPAVHGRAVCRRVGIVKRDPPPRVSDKPSFHHLSVPSRSRSTGRSDLGAKNLHTPRALKPLHAVAHPTPAKLVVRAVRAPALDHADPLRWGHEFQTGVVDRELKRHFVERRQHCHEQPCALRLGQQRALVVPPPRLGRVRFARQRAQRVLQRVLVDQPPHPRPAAGVRRARVAQAVQHAERRAADRIVHVAQRADKLPAVNGDLVRRGRARAAPSAAAGKRRRGGRRGGGGRRHVHHGLVLFPPVEQAGLDKREHVLHARRAVFQKIAKIAKIAVETPAARGAAAAAAAAAAGAADADAGAAQRKVPQHGLDGALQLAHERGLRGEQRAPPVLRGAAGEKGRQTRKHAVHVVSSTSRG